jgi:uncharacterized RDD family membrane protein YckC
VTQQPASSPPSGGTGASYAGERLGLPHEGAGSVASWGRRIAALCVDWFASLLVAGAIAGRAVTSSGSWESWLPMLVFLVEVSLFTVLMGGSFGQLLLRVLVVRLDGSPVSLLRALLRTLLICLVVPPLVFNRDQRGLHDLAAGTVTLRR